MTRTPRTALLGALGCLAALTAVWVLAFASGFGHWADAATLQGFMGLLSPRAATVAHHVGTLVNPEPFVVLGAVLTVIALRRGRPRTALVVPLILLGANVTSQLLKPALATPRFAEVLGTDQINAASWPSGHATGAMSLVLCAVLVASPRWRPAVAAIGAAFAVAVSYSILALAWHFPSDILGGFLVAALWTCLGVGALWGAGARWPARTGRAAAVRARDTLAPSGAALLAAATCAAAVALVRPEATLAYARAHTTFVVGAAALAMAGSALAAGMALALRR
ncbi:MAG: phosphatase PAP2 family protein [Actinomycetota bacterium]|nr:phosphatase PAP2 family protein [Actinomycetota bacterium]